MPEFCALADDEMGVFPSRFPTQPLNNDANEDPTRSASTGANVSDMGTQSSLDPYDNTLIYGSTSLNLLEIPFKHRCSGKCFYSQHPYFRVYLQSTGSHLSNPAKPVWLGRTGCLKP